MARGSSPLARGLQRAQVSGGRVDRIIPARAGFTCRARRGSRTPADHPRSRGVYNTDQILLCQLVGSSPLARGLQNLPAGIEVRTRIIPARAGFTLRIICIMRSFGDHPRSRGVYLRHQENPSFLPGSYPLARGLPVVFMLSNSASRIIPARAGFTKVHSARRRKRADHPRSRGVYRETNASLFNAAGSSPLARGLRGSGMPSAAQIADHPRSRGVYAVHHACLNDGVGSSPLARGLPYFGSPG